MVYMGSKSKLAKDLVPIIEELLKQNPTFSYVEPFVGGANLIDKVNWPYKFGFDLNPYLIALLNKAKQGAIPEDPAVFDWSRNVWNYMRDNYKENPDEYPEWFIGWYGFIASFSGKFFGSYGYTDGKPTKRNQIFERHRHLIRQAQKPLFKQCKFDCANYKDLNIGNAVVYCDPPYDNTTKYGMQDYEVQEFIKKCKEWTDNGCVVLLSELQADETYWECIWEKPHKYTMGHQEGHVPVTEKLFRFRG